jgi:hypothetical protein
MIGKFLPWRWRLLFSRWCRRPRPQRRTHRHVSLEVLPLEERAYPGQVFDLVLGSALAGTGWIFLDRSLLGPPLATSWGVAEENGSSSSEHVSRAVMLAA